jgi:predicted permease
MFSTWHKGGCVLLNDLLYRCRAIFQRGAVERELDDEIRFHTDRLIEKLMRSGMTRDAAARQARLTTGGAEQQKELCREARGTRLLEETWQDLRYALRTLRASPVFAATAVLTLALGTGANLVSFSGLNTVLFRKLPVARPDELVEVTNDTHPPLPAFSYPDYKDFRDRNNVFSALAGYRFIPMSLSTDGHGQRLWGYVVTGNYFDMLGEKAFMGRTLQPGDDQQEGSSPVAVISYGCWQRRFGSDPAVIGRQATISGHSYTIVGVTRAQFFGTQFFFSPGAWVPLAMLNQIEPEAREWRRSRGAIFLWVAGRLKPGVSSGMAQSALRGIAAQLGLEYPDQSGGMKLSVGPPGMLGGSIRWAAMELAALLIGITGLVLLVACTNLASLLLARGTARRKEIALRLALGAGRGRLVRQLFAESALLAVAGALAGFLLAHWLIGVVAAWRPPVNMQVRANFEIDARGWLFSAGLAVATALLFGLAPALSAARADVAPTLKGDSGVSGRRRRWPARDLLIAAQVALSMLLLAGAGIVTGSIRRALQVNLGFDPAHTTVAAFDTSIDGHDDAHGREFERRLLEKLRTQPGVESAAIASMIPLDLRWIIGNIYFEGAGPVRQSDTPQALFYQVTPGYFQTMRTRLLAGRDFDERDRAGAPRVAVVNETFARSIPRKSSAIGSRFRLSPNGDWIQVVGVVESGKHVSLSSKPVLAVYISRQQYCETGATVALRSNLSTGAALGLIRRTVAAIDPAIALYDAGSLAEHLSLQALPGRSAAGALSGFGLLALLLAATGIYGIVAYAVSLRTREIGIRMAIGAGADDILRLVVGRVAFLLAAGMLAGLAAAALLTPLLMRTLFGAPSSNVFSFMAAGLAMAAAAAVACWAPARRALAIEPAAALRSE